MEPPLGLPIPCLTLPNLLIEPPSWAHFATAIKPKYEHSDNLNKSDVESLSCAPPEYTPTMHLPLAQKKNLTVLNPIGQLPQEPAKQPANSDGKSVAILFDEQLIEQQRRTDTAA